MLLKNIPASISKRQLHSKILCVLPENIKKDLAIFDIILLKKRGVNGIKAEGHSGKAQVIARTHIAKDKGST